MTAFAYTDVTFQIGATAYSCSVKRAEITNTPNILEDNSLCGPVSAVGRTKYQLELEGFQDWFVASSLAKYLFDNEGISATATVTWPSPDETDEVVAVATVTLVSPGFGGTADELATFAVTLPIDGKPTITATLGS